MSNPIQPVRNSYHNGLRLCLPNGTERELPPYQDTDGVQYVVQPLARVLVAYGNYGYIPESLPKGTVIRRTYPDHPEYFEEILATL